MQHDSLRYCLIARSVPNPEISNPKAIINKIYDGEFIGVDIHAPSPRLFNESDNSNDK